MSFYSIDCLVEFGMGMAIARQMMNTMNHTMRNMYIPGAGNPPDHPPKLERIYYAVLDGKQAGPFSETELVRLVNDKKLSKETYVWRPGLHDGRLRRMRRKFYGWRLCLRRNLEMTNENQWGVFAYCAGLQFFCPCAGRLPCRLASEARKATSAPCRLCFSRWK